MKRQILYRLAQMRHWANTPKGERAVVRTMTALTFAGIIDAALLAIGCMMSN